MGLTLEGLAELAYVHTDIIGWGWGAQDGWVSRVCDPCSHTGFSAPEGPHAWVNSLLALS